MCLGTFAHGFTCCADQESGLHAHVLAAASASISTRGRDLDACGGAVTYEFNIALSRLPPPSLCRAVVAPPGELSDRSVSDSGASAESGMVRSFVVTADGSYVLQQNVTISQDGLKGINVR